ncbi:MAG: hypothetical protein WC436_02720 [Candidatus Babeliales bacterium]
MKKFIILSSLMCAVMFSNGLAMQGENPSAGFVSFHSKFLQAFNLRDSKTQQLINAIADPLQRRENIFKDSRHLLQELDANPNEFLINTEKIDILKKNLNQIISLIPSTRIEFRTESHMNEEYPYEVAVPLYPNIEISQTLKNLIDLIDALVAFERFGKTPNEIRDLLKQGVVLAQIQADLMQQRANELFGN